jgi:hypothetical protein
MKSIFYYIGVILLANLWGLNMSAQAFMPTWTSVSSNMSVKYTTNVLQKLGSNGWNCGARSVEVLEDSTDGWIEMRYTTYNKNAANEGFGFASTNPDHGLTYMAQAFYVTSTTASAYESGNLIASTTLATNDVLRLSKVGNVVYYLINGTAIATDTITTLVDYFIDTGIRNHNCHIHGLICSFGTYETHQWDTLTQFSHSSGQLTRSGSSAAYAYSDNFIPPTRTGFVELKIDTAHKHSYNWYWGLTSTAGTYSTWDYAVKIKPNSDSAAFCQKGVLLTTFNIAHNDILMLNFMGDRVVLTRNNVIKSEPNHFTSKPLIFAIASPGTSGNVIHDVDFKLSFPADSKYVHVDATEVDGDTPATTQLVPYGFGSGTKESVWAEDFVTREDWDDDWDALDDEIKQLLDTLPYDDVFATKTNTLSISDPGKASVWYHQLSPDTTVKGTYRISNKTDVKTNTGYAFTDNVASKTTTSTGRFILENGSIPGCTDGEISFQIFRASANVRVGFSTIGSTANSSGTHMSHFFYINGSDIYPMIGSTIYDQVRSYAYGDIATIKITGTLMQFLINDVVVHTHTLAGTENLQFEIFYNSNPTTNRTYVKVLQNTLANVFVGKTLAVRVTHASCDGSVPGSATLNFIPKNWVNPSYVITDLADNSTEYSGTSAVWNNLVPGSYSLVVSYNMQSLAPMNFNVGYEVDWNDFSLNANLTESGTGDNRVLTHTNSISADVAQSRNVLLPGLGGWISWDFRIEDDLGFFAFVGLYSFAESLLNSHFGYSPQMSLYSSAYPGNCSSSQTINLLNYKSYQILRDSEAFLLQLSNQTTISCPSDPIEFSGRKMLVFFLGTSGKVKNAAASFPCQPDYAETIISKVERKIDAGYVEEFDDILYFNYFEEYSDTDGQLNYSIYPVSDSGDNPVITESIQQKDVDLGENVISIDMSDLWPGVYILKVSNEKNENFFLRFKKL